MACPQCGSIETERDGTRENYSMAKGMVGQAMLGDIGSLAGFENQTVWKCTACGCRFVEGLNKNKIISSGIKNPSYYNIGTKIVEIKGSVGYSYKINGIHLDISKNGMLENHFEIPTLKKVEYKLDQPTLILNYLCKDGIIRTKYYTDISKENLQKLINTMRTSIEIFKKDQWHDFIMQGKQEPEITLVRGNGDTYKDQQKSNKTKYSLILSLAIGAFIAFDTSIVYGVMIGMISFPIAYVSLSLQKSNK